MHKVGGVTPLPPELTMKVAFFRIIPQDGPEDRFNHRYSSVIWIPIKELR